MPSRTFVAIPLTAPVRSALSTTREAFLAEAPGWRGEKWVDDLHLHVTLKFIGPLPDASLGAVAAAMQAACWAVPAFGITFANVRAVPGPKRARMLWAESAVGGEEAAALATAIDAALAPFDVPAEDRSFKPHATLARARCPRRVPECALETATNILSGADASMSVLRASLYSSISGKEGPTYAELASAALRTD